MKRLIATMIAVYSSSVFAQTATESVKAYEHNIIEYRFVGLTPETTDGEIRFGDSSGIQIKGVAAMHRLCQKSYGNEARAATIQEAYFRNEKDKDSRSGWVAPSGPILVLESGDGSFIPMDASTGNDVGRRSSATVAMRFAYCGQYTHGIEDTNDPVWYGPVSSGGNFADKGTIYLSACDTEHAVACSIPVRITATGLTKVTNGRFKK